MHIGNSRCPVEAGAVEEIVRGAGKHIQHASRTIVSEKGSAANYTSITNQYILTM